VRSRFRPSHGTVVAYLALFVALGGTAYAATGGSFILGQPNSASTATQLSSGARNALKVSDTNGGTGVYASGGKRSNATAAIHGQSGAGNAVEGYSTSNPASGVFGQDNNLNSYGVAGRSNSGTAVVGDSSDGWAMQALGNTTQARTRGGFVKAMALIDRRDHPSDPIRQCFNSQRPASQSMSGNCGITFNVVAPGDYFVDFGFRVNDRFPVLTSQWSQTIVSAIPTSTPSTFEVSTFRAGAFDDYSFYIAVF